MDNNIRILLFDESDYLYSVISPLQVEWKDIRLQNVSHIDDLIHALDEFQPQIIIVNNKFSSYESLTTLAIAKKRNPDLPYILFYDRNQTIREVKKIAQDAVPGGVNIEPLLTELQLILKEFSSLPQIVTSGIQENAGNDKTLNILKELYDFVFLIDEDGFILSSGENELSSGLLMNELKEQHIQSILNYYFDAPHAGEIEKIVFAPGRGEYEAWTKEKDKQRFFQIKIIPASEEIKFFIIQDTTFDKHNEQMLINRGKVLDNLHVGIITLNLDESITYCNVKALEYFSFRLPQVFGKLIENVLQIQYLQSGIIEMKKNLFEKGEWRGSISIKGQSGKLFFDLQALLLKDNEDIVNGVMYLFTKIDENRKYFYSIEDHQAIMEHMRSGFCVLSHEQIVYSNESFARLLGYNADEIPQIPFSELIVSEQKEMVRHALVQLTLQSIVPDELEVRFIHKNGINHLDTSLELGFIQPSGNSLTFCFMRESRIAKQVHSFSLQSSENSTANFDSGRSVDHDFRTSLNAIIGFADILREQFKDSTDQTVLLYTEHILSSGNKLMGLLEQNSEVTDPVGKGSVNVVESILVGDLIAEVITDLQPVAMKENAKLSLRHIAKIHAFADKQHLRQVIELLIKNALENSHAGSVVVDCGFDTLNSLVFIKIRDSRDVIREEVISRLLDPISESIEGYDSSLFETNMTFSSAKRILGSMNGRIEIRSAMKPGLIITMQLPFDESSKESIEHRPSIFYTVSSELIYLNELHPYFLVVEDDPGSSKMLEITLKNISRLDFAPDGDEALIMIRSNYEKGILYDLLLFDIGLPEPWTGMTLRKKIIDEFPEYKEIPFVAQTAYVLKDDRQKILNSGFEGFISKPIDRRYLIKTLASIMMKHRNDGEPNS